MKFSEDEKYLLLENKIKFRLKRNRGEIIKFLYKKQICYKIG